MPKSRNNADTYQNTYDTPQRGQNNLSVLVRQDMSLPILETKDIGAKNRMQRFDLMNINAKTNSEKILQRPTYL